MKYQRIPFQCYLPCKLRLNIFPRQMIMIDFGVRENYYIQLKIIKKATRHLYLR